MKSTASEFKKNVRMALLDPDLRKAMGFIKGGFVENRRAAVERLPELKAEELTGLTFTAASGQLGATSATGIFDWPGASAGR